MSKRRPEEELHKTKATPKADYCTKKCERLTLGTHIVHHINDALERNGPKLTRDQCYSQVLGMCGGGVITPKQMHEIMRAVNAWYDKREKDSNNDNNQ